MGKIVILIFVFCVNYIALRQQNTFKLKSQFVILFLLLLLNPFNLQYPQSNESNFVHLISENGLYQNTVHAILQDKKGFIWFATEDGLNKYDGYNFTVYKNNPQDSNSISDNFIWTIYEDNSGTLWIGTNSGGLSKFNDSTETFTNFRNNIINPLSISHNNIRAIYEDHEGNLWIGTEGGGLNKFNLKNNSFISYTHDPKNSHSLSNNVVLAIYEDLEGDLWVGSDGGLDMFDKKKNQFNNFTFNPDDPNSLSNNVVLSLYEDSAGNIWIGTLRGLTSFSKKEKKFTRYFINALDTKNSNVNRINSMIEDKTGQLWVATGGGLFKLDKTENKLTEIKSSSNINSLDNSNILSLYEDRSGIVWIGTAEKGIFKFDRRRTKFKLYTHDPFNPNSLSHNTIRAIYQEENGTLWIGTLGGGLNKLNPNSDKFIKYLNDHNDKSSISDNSISAILKDSYGYFWVGTWGNGLNKSQEKNNSANLKFNHYIYEQNNPVFQRASKTGISNNIIQAIYEDSDKNLWVGTGGGLNLYDRKNDAFIKFVQNPKDSTSLSGDQVQSCIHEDIDGNLWIGTWDGLNKIPKELRKNAITNPSAVKFKNYRFSKNNQHGLSDDRVISMYEDKNGNLWFGTYGGGLNKLSYSQKELDLPKFESFTIKDGLASNIIYRILGDDKGNLWISTDNGLTMFNPSSNTSRNFDVNDGLQSNQFFWGAGFKGKNGELFFGGTNGFNAFYPDQLKNNTHIPPVVITNFQIFNKPVEINTDNAVLNKSISLTKEVTLSYSQNVFSFEFAALDYTSPNKNRYAYMMDGFDKDWIYSGNRRYVTYTNLDPGKYTFKVKGSNNDGIWNPEGASIVIQILPPLWRTWWFIVLAVFTIVGIITLIIYYRIKNLIEMGRFRTKLAADLHDNIGSSLTEISILSEVISKKIKTEDRDITKSLNTISDNSRNLVDSMSDIVWLVNPKRDSLYDLILRLRDTYSELSSYTNISFRSENIISLQKVSLSMERRQHLYLIFKEAINNCITHSECTEITLDAFVKNKMLEMTLKDNGRGFCMEQIGNGNGIENIKKRAKIIGGVLQISSKVGEGTEVRFHGNIL